MNRKFYHDFEIDDKTKGMIDIEEGDALIMHTDIDPIDTYLGIGVHHVYDSGQDANDTTDNWYGKKFGIALEPHFDPENLHDIYKDKAVVVCEVLGVKKKKTVVVRGYADWIWQTQYYWVVHRIEDKSGNILINFKYDLIKSGDKEYNRLKEIQLPNGKTVHYSYNAANELTQIGYSNGETIRIRYVNNSNVERIVSQSLKGADFTYTNEGLANSVKNISFMQSVTHDFTIPDFFNSSNIAGTPRAVDNEVEFSYTPSQKKRNESTTFLSYSTMRTIAGSGEQTLWEYEENKCTETVTSKDGENISKTEYTWRPAISYLIAREHIVYNRGKPNWQEVVTHYEYDDVDEKEKEYHPISQRTCKFFKAIVDGVESNNIEYEVAITEYDYVRQTVNGKMTRKLKEVKTKQGIVANQTDDPSIHIGFEVTKYTYGIFGKLVSIEHPNDLVEKFVYDNNIDIVRKEIELPYFQGDLQFKQEYVYNKGRVAQAKCERGFATGFTYDGDSQRITSMIDPMSNTTSFGLDSNSNKLNFIKTISNGVVNETSAFDTKGYLTRLDSGKAKYNIRYDNLANGTKTQRFSKGESPYITTTQSDTKDNNGFVTQSVVTTTYGYTSPYGYGEKLRNTYSNQTSELEYEISDGVVAKLATITKDSFQDHLTGETTRIYKDAYDNVIATGNEAINTSICIENLGGEARHTKSTYNFKTLGKTHEYLHSRIKAYNMISTEIVTLPTGINQSKTYDRFGRVKSINGSTYVGYSYVLGQPIPGSQYYYTTSLVKSMSDYLGQQEFSYNDNGDICTISQGADRTYYHYDAAKRLEREDNPYLNKTFVYTYDNNGNILSKTIYPYTTANNLSGGSVVNYSYETDSDKMLSYNGELCEYNSIGNPTIYRGANMGWSRIRNLDNIDNGLIKYTYNAQNLRVSKTINNKTTNYIWSGDKLMAQTWGAEPTYIPEYTEFFTNLPNAMIFLYGVDGITGFTYNDTPYYYRKNLQGDVTHIRDDDGQILAKYNYDAWGNHEIEYEVNGIGTLNPIRYRGYYYDNETGFYYLKSRYYDPEVGRFINADSLKYLDLERINGLNLYSYCGNNPVMNIDPNGNLFWFIFAAVAIGAAVGGTVKGVQAYALGARGWDLFGAIAGGAVMGGVMGGLMAFGGASALSMTGFGFWGGITISAGIGILGGFASYSIEHGIRGDWNLVGFLKAGVSGGAQGAFTFGIGYIGGYSGAFDKALSPSMNALSTLSTQAYTMGKTLMGRTTFLTPMMETLFGLGLSAYGAGGRMLIDWLFGV